MSRSTAWSFSCMRVFYGSEVASTVRRQRGYYRRSSCPLHQTHCTAAPKPKAASPAPAKAAAKPAADSDASDSEAEKPKAAAAAKAKG